MAGAKCYIEQVGWIGALRCDTPQMRENALHTHPRQNKGLFQEAACLGHREGSVRHSEGIYGKQSLFWLGSRWI